MISKYSDESNQVDCKRTRGTGILLAKDKNELGLLEEVDVLEANDDQIMDAIEPKPKATRGRRAKNVVCAFVEETKPASKRKAAAAKKVSASESDSIMVKSNSDTSLQSNDDVPKNKLPTFELPKVHLSTLGVHYGEENEVASETPESVLRVTRSRVRRW